MDFQYRNILKEPPSYEELEELALQGGMEVKDLVNHKSRGFKNTGVELESMSSREAGSLIIENPRIMHRPIFTDGNNLVVGLNTEELERIF